MLPPNLARALAKGTVMSSFYLAFLYSETIIKGKDKLVGTLFSASKGVHLLFTEAIARERLGHTSI